jgi:hypothetical protein
MDIKFFNSKGFQNENKLGGWLENKPSCNPGHNRHFPVTLGCGGTSSQNCTYFESSGTVGAGQCAATICKCSSDICQVIGPDHLAFFSKSNVMNNFFQKLAVV